MTIASPSAFQVLLVPVTLDNIPLKEKHYTFLFFCMDIMCVSEVTANKDTGNFVTYFGAAWLKIQ